MKKYKVSQELMNELNGWRDRVGELVIGQDLMVSSDVLPSAVKDWWLRGVVELASEKNNRLIALIRYVNGKDVFEVEKPKPKKWIVRNVYSDDTGDYTYIFVDEDITKFTYIIEEATKFNTKEEAEQFTNPLMEVVEVEE